jgi:hypothetical protein
LVRYPFPIVGSRHPSKWLTRAILLARATNARNER